MTEEKTKTFRLLEQWHGGDPKGLDALIERCLPRIREMVRQRLRHMLRSKEETCDFVQDAVVEFLRYGPRFILSDENHFQALLFRIVENTLRNKADWYTAKRRTIARERPLPDTTILSLDPPRASFQTPSRSAERHEREAWVRLAMEFLPFEDREVLVLRQWENLSFNKIGERLELKPNTARMRHSRALRRLAGKVAELRSLKLDTILEEDLS